MREGVATMDVRDVQERWLDARDAYDEKERRDLEEARRVEQEAKRRTEMSGNDDDDDDLDMGGTAVDGGVKIVRK
jgi:hypothetical protein